MAQGIKPGIPHKQCAHCHTPFQPNTTHHNYCSRKCKDAVHHKRHTLQRKEWWRNWIAHKLQQDPDFHRKKYAQRKLSPTYRTRMNLYANKTYQRHRQAALSAYGSKCACCGESNKEFLAIDHINGGGTSHRKFIKTYIYRYLKLNNYPRGFRLLCHNCNSSLGFYGYCPHNKLV